MSVQVYPATIGGSATDRVTTGTVTLTARRTGETDERGCEVYDVQVPLPAAWMAAGRVVLHFDLVPGRSAFRIQFTGETQLRPVRGQEYDVFLAGRGGMVIDARHLDDLADQIEHLVRLEHPREHVGIRLEADGTVWVRLGFAPSTCAGTWLATP